jgi:hypothetical protein
MSFIESNPAAAGATGAFSKPPPPKRRNQTHAFELKVERVETAGLRLRAALAGDAQSLRIAAVITGWLDKFQTGSPIDCLACGALLRRVPTAIVILLPLVEPAEQAIAGGLCAVCAGKPDADLVADLMPTIRKLMPSATLRVLQRGGRA